MNENKTLVLENTRRRDDLIEIEKKYQQIWNDEKVFEVDAVESNLPMDELHKKYPKYFACMAYPYMNGVLHAGHSFTLSKAEFATGYERMNGKRALFPMGFHCTGMPIKACADKLKREQERFGENFDKQVDEPEPAATEQSTSSDPTKFKSGKSKVNAKTGNAKYQFEIMLQLGIPREEIKKYADPLHWIESFPPKCQQDCQLFGSRIDWRRSFVTTDVNPYYDAFVRWQMNALKAADKIKFGKRHTIFSAKDGQPCMDHDRQTGEGVNPQEYVAIKIRVVEFPEAAKALETSGKKVYVLAATLRPETMYGQNCCFVSPKITYSVFDNGNDELFICTERAYKNMAFQNLTPVYGKYDAVCQISGADLVGAKIDAPLSVYKNLRLLPMDTILPTKGTGIVTCVPSDSPDDYITTQELKKKPDFYKINADWVISDIVPLIETPTYGNLTAKTLVEQLKINSPKDKDLLATAKELAYKEGFYQGVLLLGEFKGEKVQDAKQKIRDLLISQKQAFAYSEPEGLVISRSGDSCVVSLQDQWFSDYGEDSWRETTERCLAKLNTFGQETRHGFEKTLGWLKNWALSRSYGLGTKIPWDPQYLVESLSDSTIYMAYYTICHFLHADFYGNEQGLLNIPAKDMTDEVWDYIYCRSDSVSSECRVSKEKLDKMRNEFRFFYPVDVRVSGKDLIPNHLTFFLYCHTAIFDEEFWPAGVRANGHLMLNNEKMSKSTGNFMTLRQMIEKFGCDASRIALADAGDTFEDANFDESNANAAILRLHTLKEWSEYVSHPEELREGELNFFDTAFTHEINNLIEIARNAYESAQYKNALKAGLFDLQIARDYYREVTQLLGLNMHKALVKRYIEVQVLLLQPIAPHFCEYVWRELLGHTTTVHDAKFPVVSDPVNQEVLDAVIYVRSVSRSIREAEGALRRKRKNVPQFDLKAPCKLTIYLGHAFPEWQDAYVELVRSSLESLDFKDNTGAFKSKVSKLGDPKRGMQFVSALRQDIIAAGDAKRVLDRKLSFDEVEIAKKAAKLLELAATGTNVQAMDIVLLKDGTATSVLTSESIEVPSAKIVSDTFPGQPSVVISAL